MRISVAPVVLAASLLSFFCSTANTQTPDATPLSKQVAVLEEKFARDEQILQDWPNPARYHDSNSALPSPSKDESRVVFMGYCLVEPSDVDGCSNRHF
jgi:hypothetical protein